MAKTDYQSVDQYLKQQPEAAQKQLERVRRAIQKAVPRAEEAISYQIPAFKLDGHALLYFAGWKEHYSLYPATAGVVARFGKELKGHLVSKGTLRFALSEPVPTRLIAGIASQRASEVAELEARKGSRSSAKKSAKKAIQRAAPKAKPKRASAAKRKSG
jgi:uncharacterized protein YdhG (YjbR/CyaY superfamily)